LSHPLQIGTVNIPAGGRIGLTFCPGKRDLEAMTGPWDRDLDVDLQAMADWGADALVTLMEWQELAALGVPDIGERAQAWGMAWFHLPIRDVSVPDEAFEVAWHQAGRLLRGKLLEGEGVVIHCRGGLGRTGMIAARLLVELGEAPELALGKVRAVRPGAVETPQQEACVLSLCG
jgi:ADP-ribosyl-[dinitrogen reductase] hydrolase